MDKNEGAAIIREMITAITNNPAQFHFRVEINSVGQSVSVSGGGAGVSSTTSRLSSGLGFAYLTIFIAHYLLSTFRVCLLLAVNDKDIALRVCRPVESVVAHVDAREMVLVPLVEEEQGVVSEF